MEKPIVTDRSRIECGWACPRKRYWAYEYNGWGLEPEGTVNVDLAYGLAFHEGAEILARGGTLAEALERAHGWTDKIEGVTIDGLPKKDEYYALAYGHLRTLSESILPRLLEDYTCLAVEEEIVLPLDPGGKVLDLTRLDIGFKDKATGLNYNIEWKTSANPSNIAGEMKYNVQFLLNCKALSLAIKEPVQGTIIVGVDKGRNGYPSAADTKLGLTGNRRESPFTYAYMKDTGFTQEWRLEWTKGWKKTPVWTTNTDSVVAWYAKLHSLDANCANDQFVIANPIQWEEETYKRIAKQLVLAETQSASMDPLLSIDEVFPMHLTNCHNDGGYKRACPFIDLCHFGKATAPLEWGYKWRTANHPLEETIRRRPDASSA